ncbi:MAG: GNAT family N-acetyltransferase [Caulobacter sp.]|nr:GNAT family N-acetyltransferase [Caulobacter sp.]
MSERNPLPSAGRIRPLAPADRAAWDRLWAGYLTFYDSGVAPEVTEATWTRLLDPAAPMFALVAEDEAGVFGLAQCVLHASTWSTTPYCYLNDLFVDPARRGGGAGRALIEAVQAEADARGAGRVYWMTHETNAVARQLYDRVATRSGFIQYQR